MKLKGLVKHGMRKIGLEIHRYAPPVPLPPSPIISSMRKFEIDLVLDVGANAGQFASEIRCGGYAGNIVSFEPLTEAHRKLLRASEGDDRWDIYPRCALGDRNGEVEINIAGNSDSSSILPMLESHRSAAPESAYLGQYRILGDRARKQTIGTRYWSTLIQVKNAPRMMPDRSSIEIFSKRPTRCEASGWNNRCEKPAILSYKK